jgi:DNA replication and repair protein RecF
MHVSHLRLTNFRNYRSLELTPPPGLVLLVGENAQGKTNLLEAMFYLSTSRSPRTTRDAELVAWQVPEGDLRVARAEATVVRAAGSVTLDVTVMAKVSTRTSVPAQTPEEDAGDFVAAAPGAQKRIRVNGVPRRAMDLLGNFPVALFRPEDVDLVAGPPSVRRRSVDILISQLEPRYPRALQRYARAVTQRNHLLKQMQDRRIGPEELAPWDDLLVRDGVLVIAERSRALNRLSPLAAEAHTQISGSRDVLSMQYRPTAATTDATDDALEPAFRAALAAALRRDIAIGQTTVGPHRDDVALLINGAPAGDYGSRGQQRTAALAWRLAEAAYLHEVSHEPPVVLLDDVLSELDALRREAVLQAMAPFDQVFLTTTGAELGGTTLRSAAVYTVHRGALVV